ncbi:MAG: SDR family oxidoreductase [Pseudomonadota bacterium]
MTERFNVNSKFSLDGRVALITGASSGIGWGLAEGLAAAGAKVVAAARRKDRLETLVEKIEAQGGTALGVKLDVTDTTSIAQAFTVAEQKLGVVDIVVNNAGVADGKTFLDADTNDLDFVLDANLKGVWNVAHEASRRMVEAGKPGSIINIASVLGLGGKSRNAAYCASKGGVVNLTRAMSMDLGRHGIRVNAIAPGWFVTEINGEFLTSEAGDAYMRRTPARRAGQIEELIGPAILLASEAGSFVNGAILPVDGAHSAALV